MLSYGSHRNGGRHHISEVSNQCLLTKVPASELNITLSNRIVPLAFWRVLQSTMALPPWGFFSSSPNYNSALMSFLLIVKLCLFFFFYLKWMYKIQNRSKQDFSIWQYGREVIRGADHTHPILTLRHSSGTMMYQYNIS